MMTEQEYMSRVNWTFNHDLLEFEHRLCGLTLSELVQMINFPIKT
jgi:hypothetical protein